jgi:hypothetical protein
VTDDFNHQLVPDRPADEQLAFFRQAELCNRGLQAKSSQNMASEQLATFFEFM